jgi:GH18 family chitinase
MLAQRRSISPGLIALLVWGVSCAAAAQSNCIGAGTSDAPYRCTAVAESTVSGSASGSYVNTYESDDIREVLTEQDETIGPPPKRCDFLDHRWQFDLPLHSGGWKLFVEGYRDDAGSNGDDFIFFFSTDGSSFTPSDLMVDGDPPYDKVYESTNFLADSGNLYIKAADTDCGKGNRNNASLFIDHLYLESIDSLPPPPVGGSNTPIVGYFTNWSQYGRNFCINNIVGESDCAGGSISESSADFVTHIKYAFFNHDASGVIFSGDEFSDHNKAWGNEGSACDNFPNEFGKKGGLCQLKILKQKFPHIKTLLSIGGWTWSDHFSDIYADPDKRVVHCDSILWYLTNYELDGIDIDWEYPGVQGEGDNAVRSCNGHEGDLKVSPCDAENFREFINYCGPRLKAQDKLLTMALPCDPNKYNDYSNLPSSQAGELDLDGMIANIDSIDLLSYDLKGSWSPLTGHHSGLGKNNNEANYFNTYPETEFNIQSCVQGYIANGVPEEKISVGIPIYGHSWKGIEDVAKGDPPIQGLFNSHTGVPKGTWDGGQWGISGVFDYEDIVDNLIPKALTVEYDSEASAAALTWKLRGNNGNAFMSYVNPEGVCERASFVVSNNLRGLMFWEFSGDIEDDERSLIKAMYCAFNSDDADRCPFGNPCDVP